MRANYPTVKIQKLFPTYLYQSRLTTEAKISKLNKELLIEAYQIQHADLEGQIWSEKNYLGGFTTYGSMGRLDVFSSTFNILKKYLDIHVEKFAKELEFDVAKGSIKLNSLWLNIMPSHVVHSNHLHPQSVISGTYYLQMPPKASALKFEDPRLNSFMAAPALKPNARQDRRPFHSIKATPGDLVLFESWLRHEVPPSLNKRDRISISFNYDWR